MSFEEEDKCHATARESARTSERGSEGGREQREKERERVRESMHAWVNVCVHNINTHQNMQPAFKHIDTSAADGNRYGT
jgi:hypothetical protein